MQKLSLYVLLYVCKLSSYEDVVYNWYALPLLSVLANIITFGHILILNISVVDSHLA